MKRKIYFWIIVPALLSASTLVTRAEPAHTFHTSLMQIEYDQQEQLVEISIHVFTNDLESVLGRQSGKKVRLDRTSDTAQLVLSYLNDVVNLKTRDGQIKTLSWVGMESQADAVWLYVEVKLPEGIEGVEVRNRILFDLFDDQINRVHIKHGEKKADLVFKRGDGFKAITLTQPAVT